MVDTIIFDLNKVLVTYAYSKYNQIFEDKIGVSIFDFWNSGKKYYHEYNIGKDNIDNFFLKTMKEFRIPQKVLPRIKELHKKCFSEVEGIKDILKKLQGKYKLILLAGDGKNSLKFKTEHFGFDKFFDKVYATCYEGLEKGELEIYERVIKMEKMNPEKAVFIDDNQEFIDVAGNAGLKTILFIDSEQLKNDLRKIGVDI